MSCDHSQWNESVAFDYIHTIIPLYDSIPDLIHVTMFWLLTRFGAFFGHVNGKLKFYSSFATHQRAHCTSSQTLSEKTCRTFWSFSSILRRCTLSGPFYQTRINFYQYVSCPTRRDNSLKDEYKSLPLPPLGSAYHNCVHLLPTYKTVLNREKTMTKDIKAWSEELVLSLQECFHCTDWDIFTQSWGNDFFHWLI